MATIVARDRHELVRKLFPRRALIAEVGVQFGRFAEALLRECDPTRLILIDPWKQMTGAYAADPSNVPDHVQQARYEETAARFADETHRVEIWRATSAQAAEWVRKSWTVPRFFNAVYLDADHTAEGIQGDLERWWPLVGPGGVLAGHDYCETPWIAVRPAVDRFAAENGLELLLSGEPDWPSWAVVKPG